jgi:hypothetical protein
VQGSQHHFYRKEIDMPNGATMIDRPQIIASRIGPIFDPKFLNLIPQEKIKDIIIIQLNAQVNAMQEEVRAVEQIVDVVKGTKIG